MKDLPFPAKCTACPRTPICPMCKAAVYLETGDMTEAPAYLCSYSETLEEFLRKESEGVQDRVLYSGNFNPHHCFRIPGRNQICEWDLLEQKQQKEEQEVSHKVLHVLPEAAGYIRNSIGVFNAVGFERILYRFKKYLFHYSYVDYKGKAVLFSAPSGGGKTTQGKLWEEYAGATMINGDRAVLEMTEDGVLCHGLPIAGSSGVFINRSLPLAAVFMLEKASENKVVRLKGKDAAYAIFSQLTVNMWDEAFVGDALDFAIAAAQSMPVYRLSCTISKEAVEAAKIQVEKIIGE